MCAALQCFDSSGKSSGKPEAGACQGDAYRSLPTPPGSQGLPAGGSAGPAATLPSGIPALGAAMNQACPLVAMQENGMMNSFPSPHCP